MKKIDRELLNQLRKNAHNRLKREYRKSDLRVVKNRKNKKQKSVNKNVSEYSVCFLVAKSMNRSCVVAPSDMSFYPETMEVLIEFIIKLRSIASKSKILIDFSNCNYISAAAATYFFSELEQLKATYGSGVVQVFKSSLSYEVNRAFVDFGLMELIHGSPKPDMNRLMPIISGNDKDSEASKVLADFVVLQARSKGIIGNDEQSIAQAQHISFRAIDEAMLNVKYHAYEGESQKKWWVTSAILADKLFIALCDRGVGMPETLPKSGFWENAIGLLPINDDGHMIHAAMAYTRSSSRKSRVRSSSGRIGRGLGTRDMQNLVLNRNSGYLTIVSRKGYYRLDGETGKEISSAIKYSIGGTIIQWSIPLNEGDQ